MCVYAKLASGVDAAFDDQDSDETMPSDVILSEALDRVRTAPAARRRGTGRRALAALRVDRARAAAGPIRV